MKKTAFTIATAVLITSAIAQTTPQKSKGTASPASDPKTEQKMDAASGGSMHNGGKHTDTGKGNSGGDSTRQAKKQTSANSPGTVSNTVVTQNPAKQPDNTGPIQDGRDASAKGPKKKSGTTGEKPKQ